MKGIFHFAEKPYSLRNNSTLKKICNRSVYFVTETISSLAPKSGYLVPNRIKNAVSLKLFKKEIKLSKCPCRLCTIYIRNVGFI